MGAPVKLAIIDTETGGFSPEKHELLEAHVLLVDDQDWTVIHDVGGRIFPTGRLQISPGAVRVNGYEALLWEATARPAAQVVPQVLVVAMHADAWVGCNAGFDVRFLQAAARRLGFDFEPREIVDVGVLGKSDCDRGSRVGLDKICERLGIPTRAGTHTARDDCYRTLAVLPHVWRLR